MSERPSVGDPVLPQLDYAALFAATPTPCLVLTCDLVIVEANRAYLEATGRTRDELVGRRMFDAFPANPTTPSGNAVDNLRASLERVCHSGRPDTMAVQKYDIPDPTSGAFVERYWSPVNVPVPSGDDGSALILHRVEDVTDYVREREAGRVSRERGQAWRRRMEESEAEVYARTRELRDALDAEALTSRRLAGLADVALRLAEAQTVEDLAEVVVGRGLVALGADGGAVAVRSEGSSELQLVITHSLGEQTRREFGQLPLTGPLPASVAAATGARVLLPDREACLAWSAEMAEVLAATGKQAWASLPLRGGQRLLGSLTVGWEESHAFPTSEVELLDAFAAQCAQALDRIQLRQTEQAATAAVLRLAETLQRSLLSDPPQPDHLQIAVRYLPAAQEAQVGGDWYDAFMVDDGSTQLVVGDVAGHDRDAAAGMAQVRNVLRGVAHTLVEPPAAVLSALDRAMSDLHVGALTTAVLAKIEQTEADAARGLRVLRWSNAGHPPPLLIDADGTARLLHAEPDLLLGLDPTTPRVDHEQVLCPGATVLLYTDGLIERRGAGIDDGLAWLQKACADLGALPLEELCDVLLAELSGPVEDDVVLLAVRAHPEDRPRPPEAGPSRPGR